ncbi:ComF family protein [Lacticaseibacillus zhaodongensis]|uniref:ComF family protein n=1 Tax=Lacticaseibacillus zhaodongensis TaxID=2668065 RepID=UPI0012D2AECB|nr:ComF family protein [Lacticaseibacillus zhaodongensis]
MGEEVLNHRAIYEYNAAMKDLIERYKGIGDYNLRHCFIKDVTSFADLHCTFVPLCSEPKHLQRRGFDPVLGIFATLDLQQWLQKADTALPQAKKNRLSRMLTPQSFSCVCSPVHMAKAQRVCLLDDLYTTGRTFHHAAAALRKAGYQGEIISRSLIR